MMKKWLPLLVVLLVFFVSSVFAQTDEAAAVSSSDKAEVEGTVMPAKKVSELPRVVKIGKIRSASDVAAKKRYKYDAKGGIIVPDAKEGIKQKNLTAEQQKKLQKMKKAQSGQITKRKVEVKKDFKSSEKSRSRIRQSRTAKVKSNKNTPTQKTD